jgi:hypothetical protein
MGILMRIVAIWHCDDAGSLLSGLSVADATGTGCVDAASVAMLDYQGRSPIMVQAKGFIGAVDSGYLTLTGVTLVGWAVSNPTEDQPALPPSEILVVSDDQVIFTAKPNQQRPDIAQKYGNQAVAAGFALMLDIALIPPPLKTNVTLYACNGETATLLPMIHEGDRLNGLNIATGRDFIRLIQSPSTRLPDPQTLAYAAYHCVRSLPPDFAIRAAALCVVGYRLLNHEIEDPALVQFFENESQGLLAETPKVSRGLFLRWHTSVRLIAGYLAFQAGREAEAVEHFGVIPNFATDLTEWPQALTNVLLGLFITGYLRYRAGRVDMAIQQWSRGEAIFRFGSSISEFQNFYAYGEVGNALRVVQECYVAMQVVHGRGPITNPSLAPPGTDIDLRRLPSPFAKLVDEVKRRIPAEAVV